MTSLYAHQQEGVRAAVTALRTYKGFYLAHDPGMGKSLEALLIAYLRRAKTIVIIGPPVSLGVWRNEIQLWFPTAGWTIASRTKLQNRDGMAAENPLFIVTNYEQLRGAPGKKLVDALVLVHPDLLVLDEAQYAKSPSSKQSQAVRKIAAASKKIVALSGTPAHNALDYHPQYRLLDPTNPIWAQTFTDYKKSVENKHPFHPWRLPGKRGWNQEYLKRVYAAMAPLTHVAEITQLKVPTPIVTPIPISLTDRERKIYDSMNKHLFADLPKGQEADAAIILTKYMRLHQITGGWVTTTDGTPAQVGRSKLDAAMQKLDEFAEKRVVIACRFLDELRALERAMARKGWLVSEITGATPPLQRQTIARAFQQDKGPMKLLLQYRAGGMSLTLTQADALMIYSMEPSVIALKQMIGRVWRLTTDHVIQILPMLVEDSVDEDLWNGLRSGLDGVDLARHLRRS